MASKRSIDGRRFELQGINALSKLEAKALLNAVRMPLMRYDFHGELEGWTDAEVEKLREAYHKLKIEWNSTYETDR